MSSLVKCHAPNEVIVMAPGSCRFGLETSNLQEKVVTLTEDTNGDISKRRILMKESYCKLNYGKYGKYTGLKVSM